MEDSILNNKLQNINKLLLINLELMINVKIIHQNLISIKEKQYLLKIIK
jgi:hypothetical protein